MNFPRNIDSDAWILGGSVLFVLCTLAGIVLIGHIESVERDRLIRQCVVSGHQEWECSAALDKCGAAPAPILIPMPR